jgi:hypothetical protein
MHSETDELGKREKRSFGEEPKEKRRGNILNKQNPTYIELVTCI